MSMTQQERTIRVAVCDDHVIVCEGLRALLERDSGLEVAGIATCGEAALRLVEDEEPDVVLLDYRLPDLPGDEVCRRLVEGGHTRVIILTSYLDEEVVQKCLRAGAHGYVVKDIAQMELSRAIRVVAAGEGYIDPKITPRVLGWMRQERAPEAKDGMSERELTLLRHIVDGKSNRQIAEEMGLAESTVKGYVQQLLGKFGVHHRLEAATEAVRRGLV